jgi:SPRY domain-containing SOCS box protein 3
MMFGIATKKARLHIDSFVNLLGEDEHSWGLSHKGILWHGGKSRPFCRPFKENESTVVGVLFDGVQGTLSFYRDGVSLGVAFARLDRCQEPLFPAVSSTAAKTEMTLGVTMKAFDSLEDRCRSVVARLLEVDDDIERLPLPKTVKADLHSMVKADWKVLLEKHLVGMDDPPGGKEVISCHSR